MTAAEARLFFRMQRTAHALKKAADAALKDAAGVTTAQTAVLAVLAKHGPCSQSVVAAALSQRESAVATMVERLLGAGFVARTRSMSDKRAWELAITEQGREASEAMRRAFAPINALLDESFEAIDMARLAAALQDVLTRLES